MSARLPISTEELSCSAKISIVSTKRNNVRVVNVNLFARLTAFIVVIAQIFVCPLKRLSIFGNITMNVYAWFA
jgi:hypothetical protein